MAFRGCGRAVLAVAAIALAGCGGGGGSGVGSPDGGMERPGGGVETGDRGVIPRSEFERLRTSAADRILASPEFRSSGQWGLETVGAHQAHATLSVVLGDGVMPGEGVEVGVIDTGIDLRHPAFRDAVREGADRKSVV